MNAESLTPLSEPRRAARALLRQLRSPDAAVATAAAARFLRLRSFHGRTPEQLLADRDRVRLKHALTVLAVEHGRESWTAWKTELEAPADPPMYVRRMETLLNRWFARYEEARASLDEFPGWLLPYRDQYFVCEREGIVALGLDPDDPDWSAIGYDWVRPHDRRAWERLRQKRRAAIGAGH